MKLETPEEILPYAKKLQEKGARNVIVSMGKNGAMMVDENGEWRYNGTFDKKVINTVGAGDSFTGTFCAAILNGKSVEEAHKLAVNVSAYVCTQNGAMPEIPERFKF